MTENTLKTLWFLKQDLKQDSMFGHFSTLCIKGLILNEGTSGNVQPNI